ncbi:DEAD/DEAH box helicase family protein, partial [bacterium]|nr:DEAD/DEAH box helicase family protein [bacterium]
MSRFKLKAPFKPTGDQPQVIKQLTESILAGNKYQTLLGVTGSGKTFTMANIIAAPDRTTPINNRNKTLAAQLYGEFRGLYHDNDVENFISY